VTSGAAAAVLQTRTIAATANVSARSIATGYITAAFPRRVLESRIIPKRIEHRIEPEQSRSKRHVCRKRAVCIRYREQFLQSSDVLRMKN
jgi:hypothetical protein